MVKKLKQEMRQKLKSKILNLHTFFFPNLHTFSQASGVTRITASIFRDHHILSMSHLPEPT